MKKNQNKNISWKWFHEKLQNLFSILGVGFKKQKKLFLAQQCRQKKCGEENKFWHFETDKKIVSYNTTTTLLPIKTKQNIWKISWNWIIIIPIIFHEFF